MKKAWRLGFGAFSAFALVASVGAFESPRVPPEARTFEIVDHSVGRMSQSTPMQDLWVHVEIRRVGLRIAGNDRSEICGVFENRSGLDWSGGYRVTDRGDGTTYASMRVPAGDVVRKCQTLNPQSRYTVVVRRDGGS